MFWEMTIAPYFLAKQQPILYETPKGIYHKADATVLYLITEIFAEDFITSQRVQLSEGESAWSFGMDKIFQSQEAILMEI